MMSPRTIRFVQAAAASLVLVVVGCVPASSPADAVDLTPGDLEPGTRYRVSLASDTGSVAFSFAVPGEGWSFDGSEVIGHPDSALDSRVWFFLTSSMYSDAMPITPAVLDDPCVHDTFQTFDTSLAGWAEALASIPRTELVSGPTEVTFDARPGQVVAVEFPADLGCENSDFWLMFNASCGAPRLDCSNYPSWPGESLREWLVDVNEEIFNIRAQVRDPAAGADVEAETQQIVDSIQFEQPAPD
jgi:hypothetical protein